VTDNYFMQRYIRIYGIFNKISECIQYNCGEPHVQRGRFS